MHFFDFDVLRLKCIVSRASTLKLKQYVITSYYKQTKT